MALSTDAMSSYFQTRTNQSIDSAKADRSTKALSGLSNESSEEELVEAAKSFEAYMIEQVIKNVKESMIPEEEEGTDSGMSNYKDYYMDATIASLAETLVDQYGSNMTDDLVEQMKRNYGIE